MSNSEYGKALELYYKGMYKKQSVGQFLCNYFSLNDMRLFREQNYIEACKYFKEKYVK